MSMENYVPISGSDTLIRDMDSGAIVNVNMSEYENHKRKTLANSELKRKLQKQESEITQLRDDIAQIKELLIQLLDAK